MKKYKISFLCVVMALLFAISLTACNTASEALNHPDESTTLPTKFEDSMTAQLFKAEDSTGCSYIDMDYIADFGSVSADLPNGVEVTGLNIKGTERDKEIYFKITYKTNQGDAIFYADNQYAYVVNDSEKILYRCKYGLSSSLVLSICRNYDETAKSVTYFASSIITLFDEEYYSEQMVIDGNKQIWCYDKGNNLKYIYCYNENDELSSVNVVNGYEPKFNDRVFTLPAYHIVDTGESLVF